MNLFTVVVTDLYFRKCIISKLSSLFTLLDFRTIESVVRRYNVKERFQWLCPIYCALFTVPFTLTVINLLHRYWAVKKLKRLFAAYIHIMLQAWETGIVLEAPVSDCAFNVSDWRSSIVVCFRYSRCSFHFINRTWLSFKSSIDDDNFVRNNYYDHFNETITGWRVLYHWVSSHFIYETFIVHFRKTISLTWQPLW